MRGGGANEAMLSTNSMLDEKCLCRGQLQQGAAGCVLMLGGRGGRVLGQRPVRSHAWSYCVLMLGGKGLRQRPAWSHAWSYSVRC